MDKSEKIKLGISIGDFNGIGIEIWKDQSYFNGEYIKGKKEGIHFRIWFFIKKRTFIL